MSDAFLTRAQSVEYKNPVLKELGRTKTPETGSRQGPYVKM